MNGTAQHRLPAGSLLAGIAMCSMLLAFSLTLEVPPDDYPLPQSKTPISAQAADDPPNRGRQFYDPTWEPKDRAELTVAVSPQPEMLSAFGASLLVASVWPRRRRK
jgi:hypothetical protein